MPRIDAARMTHDYDGELVVFLIGMRINKPWRPDLWLPAFLAMPAMLKELLSDPTSGLLGSHLTFGANGPLLVQYWSSHELLYAYASDPNAVHRPAWAGFHRRVRARPDAVGIWHETFVVGRAETLYYAMPPFGLAGATAAVPVSRRGETARQLLAHRQMAAQERLTQSAA